MSEMNAEKKKEIEKYIIKSYFGGGKNVESLANGADAIKGTDDGYIPQLIVEVTYFGESGVVMIKWNIYGDSQQNSFAMRVCREREIERNRCDSVDSMRYAWEAWRAKIQGKPVFLKTNDEDLQKDKRIEELERTVKALRAEKEVMDRHIQELEYDPMPEFKELLKKLYSTNDVEKLTWTLNHICGGRGSVNGWIAVSSFWKQNYEILSKLVGFSSVEEIQDYLTNEAECDTLHAAISSLEYNVKFARDERRDLSKKLEECEKDYISERDKAEALQTENEQLKKKLEEFSPDLPGYREFLTALYPEATEETIKKLIWTTKHIFDGGDLRHTLQVDLEYYRAISSAQAKSIYRWKELTGFSSCEEIEDYLVNEAECDTLHEAMSKLHDEVKYTSDEWASANRSNNSWKAAAECNSPKELIEKREALEKEIGIYSRALKEWKEDTGCPSPLAAKTLIESMNAALRASNLAMQKELESNIDEWQKFTGRDTPEAAKQYIDRLKGRLNKIHDCSVDW